MMYLQNIVPLFEVTSNKPAKTLCFHHKKPWLLAGHISGEIDILDYKNFNHIVRLKGHNGAVQSVNFHISNPLFVSGGSDGKIKLWDYDEICGLRSTFTLEGHIASVNDVQFHPELPWMVSASDDCTVRLWNWSSRNCITILTQHTGAVTSSSFHPRKDLILTSSLDRKLFVWDIGGLRDFSNSHMGGVTARRKRCFGFMKKSSQKSEGVRLKHILEGHISGVVSAIFHPTLPLIFSSSDDCSVYWWKIGETERSSDRHTLHQTGAISCLAYSAKLNAVMSSKDAENIYLFNASSKSRNKMKLGIHEKNLSSLCAHPTKDIFAVGYANGINVYRYARERPAFSVIHNSLYHVKDKSLWLFDCSTKKESQIVLGPIEDMPDPSFWPIVTTLSCIPQGDAALICLDNTSYRIVQLNSNGSNNNEHAAAVVVAKGKGLSAVFLAPDRFAVLTTSGTTTKEKILSVRGLENEIVSQTVLPCDVIELYSCAEGGNSLLCKAIDRVVKFDLQQSIVVAELSISSVRYACWVDSDRETSVVALVGDYFITMADGKLEHMCTVKESSLIESGAWDDENNGVFVYKTLKRIKYCLANGESGMVMFYDEPLYITRVSGRTVYCLDEHGEVRTIVVDATEYIMKSSILNKDYMKQCCMCLC